MAKPDEPGRPDHTGKPDEPGRPDHAGKPDDSGKSGRRGNMPIIKTTNNEYIWAARERITISTSAKGFTSGTYKPTTGDRKDMCAKIARFTVESADIRYSQNGTDPDTNTGKIIYETGEDTILGTQNIKNFSAIRDGGTDAIIDVEYGW